MKKFGQVKLNGLRDCKSFPIPTVRYWFTLSKLAILLLLGLLLSISRLCFGQTPVTISGIIQDSGGNVATSGTVEFDIQPQSSSIHYTVPGVTAVAPQNVVCGIASNGTLTNQANVALPCTVWGNDVISPANSTYTVIFSPNGQMTNSVSLECITGSGPYNISSPVFCPQVKVVPQYNSITTAPIGSNIIPSSPHVFTLGNSQSPYAALYADNIFASGSFSVANLTGKSLGGLRYSAPYAGLLNAMAPFQTVITDPTDTITSAGYNLANPPPGFPSPSGWIDYRKSNQGLYQGMDELWQDWGYTRNSSFNSVPTAHGINCFTKQPYSGSSATAILYCLAVFHYDSAPGVDLGSSAVPAIGSTQSQIDDVFTAALMKFGGGITQGISFNVIHTAEGDTAGIRGNTTSPGGQVDGSGEGNEAVVGAAGEALTQFSATIASCTPSCTQGATQLQLTSPSGCVFGANFTNQTPCNFGTGRPFVDITQGASANSICGLAAGLSGTLEAVTVCTPIAAASNAWGTLSGNCQPNGQDLAHPPFYTSLTCVINVTSGTFVANDVTKPLCFGANQYWDVAQVTSVTGSGPVTVGVNLYKPHASGSVVMQGGPCGSGMEIVAETAGTDSYLGYIIGATDTSTLQVTWYKQTGPSSAPFTAGLFTSNYLFGSATVTGISSSGTAVYFTGATGGTLPINLLTMNKQSIIFSGASYGPYNGTACTNVIPVSTTAANCTMAGLTSIHSAGSANFSVASAAGNPLNNINIWQIAHALDVQDETTSPPTINGAVTVMTNTVNWHVGDTVREFNHQALQITGGKFITNAQNMHALNHALVFAVGGLAGIGGGASTTTNSIISSSNGLADSSCIDGGGLYTCANIWNDSGPYGHGLNFAEAPTNGMDFLRISPTTLQRANPNYDFNLFNVLDSGAGVTGNVKSLLGDFTITARGQLGLGGTGANIHPLSNVDAITMNDKLSFSVVTTPTGLFCGTGPGAGTLADGTYYYSLGCRNSSGFCVPSTEINVAVASSPPNLNSIQCSWTRDKGLTSYQLYQGTAPGGEHLLAAVSGLNFVDDGSITPSGSMPTDNTTLGFVDQAAQVGINSHGTSGPTAFETILKSTTNLGANVTLTLPSTTGTLALTTSTATKITNSLTPAAATASQCVEQTFTYTGLVTTQQVSVSPPASLGAHVWIGSTRVSSSNTLAISFCGDATAGTPPSGNYIAVAF